MRFAGDRAKTGVTRVSDETELCSRNGGVLPLRVPNSPRTKCA